jgi:hypothetical protein
VLAISEGSFGRKKERKGREGKGGEGKERQGGEKKGRERKEGKGRGVNMSVCPRCQRTSLRPYLNVVQFKRNSILTTNFPLGNI